MNPNTLLAVVLSSTAALAAPTAVLPTKAVNLQPGQAEAVTSLLASAWRSHSQRAVVECDAGQAAAHGAEDVLEASAVGLDVDGGKALVIAVEWRRLADGAVLHRAQARAETFGELDTVVARLAAAVGAKTTVEQTVNHTNVTLSETAAPNRLASGRALGVRLSVAAPLVAEDTFAAFMAIGFDGKFERNRLFFEVAAGAMLPAPVVSGALAARTASYGGVFAELGGGYFLASTDVAPYIAASLGTRLLLSSSGFGANLAPAVSVGLVANRAARARFFAEVRVAQNAFPVGGSDGQPRYPTELTGSLGVGF